MPIYNLYIAYDILVLYIYISYFVYVNNYYVKEYIISIHTIITRAPL